jgi:hypothetical protein
VPILEKLLCGVKPTFCIGIRETIVVQRFFSLKRVVDYPALSLGRIQLTPDSPFILKGIS